MEDDHLNPPELGRKLRQPADFAVAAAVEMYAHEHQGRYPDRLEQVYTGVSLIPSCPAAGRVTFTDYQVSPNGDNFSFSCVGDNHRLRYGRSAPNCPSYSLCGGLAEPDIP